MRGALAVGAGLLFVLSGSWGNETMDMSWLLIVGIFFVLALIAIPAVFKWISLDDKTQAMGLPDGSIRSVIALTLVLLFGVLPVYLFNHVAGSGTMAPPISGLSDDAKTKAEKDYSGYSPIFVEVPVATHPDQHTWTMFLRQPADPNGVDFAKQMLVLLGTLATSVASFYFGSKTATTAATTATQAAHATARMAIQNAQGGGSATPVLSGLTTDPPAVTRPGGGAHTQFKISAAGANLNDVKTLRIQSGSDKFVFPTTSNDSVVNCDVDCVPNVPAPADWDVIVADDSGRESDPLRGRLRF